MRTHWTHAMRVNPIAIAYVQVHRTVTEAHAQCYGVHTTTQTMHLVSTYSINIVGRAYELSEKVRK